LPIKRILISRIRTIFKIDGHEREIVWAYESGQWRIVTIKLTQIDKAYGKDTPIVAAKDTHQSKHTRGLGIGIMGYIFIKGIAPSGEIGFLIDIPIIPFLYISTGINYCIAYESPQSIYGGYYYNHLQIPLLLKAEYIFDFGDPDALFNLSPFLAIGLAYEILFPYHDDLASYDNQNLVFLIKPGVEVEYKPLSFGFYIILMKELNKDWNGTFYMPNFVELAYYGLYVKYNFH